MSIKRTAKLILGSLFTLLILIIAYLVYISFQSKPDLTNPIKLKAPHSLVTIHYDRYGVPHIESKTNDLDVFFALGYVHAKDRLWQMDFQRHITKGTLSELFGKSTLEKDKMLRRWGFYRAAEITWPILKPQTQEIVKHYTAGVNAFINTQHRPLQLHLLFHHPEPWTVVDSLAWHKVLAWTLQYDWYNKLQNYTIAKKLGLEQVSILHPPYPENAPSVLSVEDLVLSNLIKTPVSLSATIKEEKMPSWSYSVEEHLTVLRALQADLGMDADAGKGSNNWVISGKLTQSGKPILANDIHLPLSAPAVWYIAELKGPTVSLMGATLPSLPSVLVGHNDHIAWGLTASYVDTQDLYFIAADAPLTPYEEKIKVRLGKDITYTTYTSDYGPIILELEQGHKLAIKWPALMPGDTTMDSLFAINYAKNWQEFVSGLQSFVTPSQNIVYADLEGNIGYYLPGKVPVRNGYSGLLPVPGDGEYEWLGFIPFDQLPHVYNPPENYIVTANNKIVPKNYIYPLTARWEIPPYRAIRILDLIQENIPLDLTKTKRMQMDTLDYFWSELKPYLLKTIPLDKASRNALAALQSWDGKMSMNSIEATQFAFWLKELNTLSPSFLKPMIPRPDAVFIAQQIKTNGSYCRTQNTKNCDEFLSQSLQKAMGDMHSQLGENQQDGLWGNLHQAYFPELGFSTIKPLGWVWNRMIRNAGGNYTVNVAIYKDSTFLQVIGPSYRQIIDFGHLKNSLFIQPLGQSENLFSPHYDDLMKMWRDGEYIREQG